MKIGFDNRKAHKKVITLRKRSKCAQDAGADITRIKEIMRDSQFKVELSFIT